MRNKAAVMGLPWMLVQMSLIMRLITSVPVDCPDKCGDVEVPYPFGLNEACSLNENFLITCNKKQKVAILNELTVKSISIEDHEMRILHDVARDCYDKTGNHVKDNAVNVLHAATWTISNTKNKFVVVGYDTFASLNGFQDGVRESFSVVNGSCSDAGCCETEIPGGLNNMWVNVGSFHNHTSVWVFNPCGYAFVVEQSQFNFSSNYLTNIPDKTFPVVLDWTIGKETCGEAAKNKTKFACKGKSECHDLPTMSGFQCKCKPGYRGNPYLHDGCQDINECELSSLNNCPVAKNCVNIEGSYTCHCPKGFHGDGRKDGEGCVEDTLPLFKIVIDKVGGVKKVVTISVSIGAIFISICTFLLWRWMAKQKARKKKATEILFFKRGETQQNFDSDNLAQVKVQELPLFNVEQLAKATNNFHLSNKLGQGGFGPVYRGTLSDGQQVAIKRLSKTSGQGLQELMNEVVVISKLQHRNLVRLLGCCVEEEEKMLVYEYMPNKSLDAFLFDPHKEKLLDWRKRFNIIEGIGRGLLYLHRDSRLRIIHRDLKASNILLDKELNPKISDFGMAKIFRRNDNQANTNRVVGTYGYMSPEYAMEGRFSEKSDVFSFGVLLLEILSGRRNSSFYHDEESSSLLGFAWKLWNASNIVALIDPIIHEPCFEMEIVRCIHVGLLCVQEFAKDRPIVSDVISMLKSEIVDLPHPKQPSFIERHTASNTKSSQQRQRECSNNNVTITMIQGR